MREKMCVVCLEVQPLDSFYTRPDTLDRRRSECKACHLIAKRARKNATPRRIGGLTIEAGVLADLCARKILEVGAPRAVTVDRTGGVWVRMPDEVAGQDVLGVYEPELGLVAITSYVRDDLLAARDEMRAAA